MKKSLIRTRFVFLSMILLLLAACQSGGLPPRPQVSMTAVVFTATPTVASPTLSVIPTSTPTALPDLHIDTQKLSGVHIQFWHPFLETTAGQIQALVNQFNRENPWGITVDTYTLGNESELYRQVLAAIPGSDGNSASGVALPDVVIANPEDAASWQAVSQVLVNLNNYIYDVSFGWNEQQLSDQVQPYWVSGSLDGEQIGIPAEGNVQLLFYNTTWARQLGFFQPPSTASEFYQQACKAALANRQDATTENDGTGGWLVNSSATSMLGWITAFDGQLKTAASGNYKFDTTEINTAFSYLKNLINNGCAWLGLNPQPYDYFASRKALFFSGDLSDLQPLEAALANAGYQDSWTLIPVPGASGTPAVIGFGQEYYLLKSTDVRQLAAWLFVKWMTAPQQQVQLVRNDSSIPLQTSEISMLSGYGKDFPQWEHAVELEAHIQPAPVDASWRQVSMVLEDAAQQLFQPETTTSQVPDILEQMDQMVAELANGAH